MRVVSVLLITLALFASVAVASNSFLEAAAEAEVGCHPECRWQCDDPVCPAKCHPVCERPKCQVHCEELEAAKCTANCDKPKCNVRCPKDLCSKEDCPKCETVCSPAVCRTACIAPEPKCTPLCQETKCDWKCKKPSLCPRPKCELVCDKASCASKDTPTPPPATSSPLPPPTGEQPPAVPRFAQIKCCPCNEQNLAASIQSANAANQQDSSAESKPSFMELMHTIKFHEQNGNEGCCKCA